MINEHVFTLKMAGAAGQGVKSSGLLFSHFAKRSGYHIFNYIEYPSIIRGGHNVMQINVSSQEVTGPSSKIDFLIALNQDGVSNHIDELKPSACVLFDSEARIDISKLPSDTALCGVPLARLVKEVGGKSILKNTVALGATLGLMGGRLETLKILLTGEFESKGDEVVEMNNKAAQAGYDFAVEAFSDHKKDTLVPLDSMDTMIPTIVLNGNEAIALGAIAGGIQFAAIYPMSPISGILQILAKHQEEFGYVYKQPEDEIAAINMALGASFAGVRSMTATSGGGFCLMSEAYGLAGITETPIVIVEGMRGGPATGIPTWSEQGDLKFILSAHQSDFPRIVLTPGDPKECFYYMMEALNLAEKYQTPVVVLIDKNICENDMSYPIFDTSSYKVDRGNLTFDKIEGYKRYELAENGISQRTVPGSGNFFIANSDEHDEVGLSSEEIKNRNDQMEKRMKKMETCSLEDMKAPELFGPEEADITIVSWGGNKGSIIQAIQNFDNVNFLHITWMSPFPTEAVMAQLGKANYLINMECNYSGQFSSYLREKTGIHILDNYLKYDGRPFYVEEVVAKINEVLKGLRD